MAINLQKGGRIDLSKESTASVFRIGLGWDAAQPGKEFDLDAMALMLKADGKCLSDNHMVFYGNLEDPTKSVKHSGDNRTGEYPRCQEPSAELRHGKECQSKSV